MNKGVGPGRIQPKSPPAEEAEYYGDEQCVVCAGDDEDNNMPGRVQDEDTPSSCRCDNNNNTTRVHVKRASTSDERNRANFGRVTFPPRAEEERHQEVVASIQGGTSERGPPRGGTSVDRRFPISLFYTYS